jgi:hypothetical protein
VVGFEWVERDEKFERIVMECYLVLGVVHLKTAARAVRKFDSELELLVEDLVFVQSFVCSLNQNQIQSQSDCNEKRATGCMEIVVIVVKTKGKKPCSSTTADRCYHCCHCHQYLRSNMKTGQAKRSGYSYCPTIDLIHVLAQTKIF